VQIGDKISTPLIVSAALAIIYLETFLGNTASLDIAITLLAVGIGLQLLVWGKIKRDETMSQNELASIAQYTLIALTGMLLASFTIPQIFVVAVIDPMASVSSLSITDQIVHGQVYAISEEIFFRGAVLGFILWQVPYDLNLGRFLSIKIQIPKEWFASALSAGIFGLYHLAVYGYSNATLYVLIAGFALGMVTAYSRRLSPAMCAHMCNNFVSVLLTVGGP